MKRTSLVVLILCELRVRDMGSATRGGKCSNNWSEFHRTNMERWNPCENVLGVNNFANLTLKWSYTTGNGIESAPAVANGVVDVGSVDHNVYALNASTGVLLWSFGAGPTTSVYSPPTMANGVVGVGSFGCEATVYALNAGTGALLWSYATDNNVGSAPAVVNGGGLSRVV
jgi:outer membrane protein assembly factor BamB